MLQSKLFGKTLKEAPKDAATASHVLLTKGGYLDQLVSGVYSLLPLGFRVYKNIEEIIRNEMNNIGGQELNMPTLQPKSLWMETKRWETIDPPLFRLKDRHGKELALGSTHEEVITDLARKNINSYKDLPVAVYQIQNKFRNEMRATGGLLRVREFIMKDLYSFHADDADLNKFYEIVKKSYIKIYKRCGVKPLVVEASSGTIGGSESNEFMIIADSGEDKILHCESCGWAANTEVSSKIKSCPKCKGNIITVNGIEAGHIFKLGTKYSQAMKAVFTNQDGKQMPLVMGCYGIGLGRLMATIVEASHDENGIIWPISVAPFKVHILPLGQDNAIVKKAQELYNQLSAKGLAVLLDDRDESNGVKFSDADLIGIPIRLVISAKTIEKDSVELKLRAKKSLELIKFNQLEKQIEKYTKEG